MSTIIERYMKEELSSAESEKVEVALIKEMFVQEQKAEWKKRIAQERQSPWTIIWRKPAITSAIAAMFALGVALFLYQKNDVSSMEALLDAQIQEGHRSPQSYMGNESQEVIWAKAIEAFKNKQYDDAAISIARINPKTSEQSFYLGLSLMFSSKADYAAAIPYFEQIQHANKSLVRESEWFLALCYLKLGEKAKAKSILEQFVTRGAEAWKVKEAKALLEKM